MFSDPAVVRVAKFEKADETIPVCLIGLNLERTRDRCGMQANLARFDFGICMAAWDGEEVYTAPEYKRDVEQKTFTLCRADDQAAVQLLDVALREDDGGSLRGMEAGGARSSSRRWRRSTRSSKTHYFDHETDEWMPREVVGPQLLTPKAR